MSEEEIIKMLKDYSATNPFQKNMFYVHNLHEAIQGILDLYNKEKEENKELHKEINQRVKLKLENERIVDEDYIPKSKVREKIDFLEVLQKEFPHNIEIPIKIISYKELLQEGDDK